MTTRLNVLPRNQKTSSVLRREGLIPAILYGHKIKNVELAVDRKEFEKVYQEVGESTIIELILKDDNKEEKRLVLIYEVQYDHLKGKPIHVDFYQVRLDEKITAHIPLRFIGEAPAVKSLGGILVKSVQEIEVEALPQDLPPYLEVDLSKLENFETNIYVKDLVIPKEVRVLISPETVVASVIPPRSEEELAAAKEEVIEKVGEVKVETEEKRVEREAEKVERI